MDAPDSERWVKSGSIKVTIATLTYQRLLGLARRLCISCFYSECDKVKVDALALGNAMIVKCNDSETDRC